MFGKHTLQQVSNNQKYTQECDKIYHSFRIAEVRITDVKEATIPMFLSLAPTTLVLLAFAIAFIRVKYYGDLGGDLSRVMIVLWIAIALIGVAVLVWIIFALQVRVKKKDLQNHRYIYRDKTGLYALYTYESNNGLELVTISNLDNLMNLEIEKSDAGIHTEVHSSKEYTPHLKFENQSGIKQFTVQPQRVFAGTDQSLIIEKHKLKQKITRGNTVKYKFYNKQGFMIGAPHPHCLVVKDGKIQYAVAHYLRKYSSGYQGYSHTNYKHTYSHIDDENIKIVFSKELLQAAKKKKFDLPQPSVNIIYEDNE